MISGSRGYKLQVSGQQSLTTSHISLSFGKTD
ncbi:hypothetical protein OYC64_015791 [Pagothenia borchgrevinki]|uniref:Uncharacterized protein n=1 Tax=Pagothenia borchgrevinki TaxID=8213 RepID=A0ABD2HIY0_PAGBO